MDSLPIIGVDSSGHVKYPPIWMVAVRESKRFQKHHAVLMSYEEHDKYATAMKNWYEKLSAALIFRAVLPIYYSGDSIHVDHDFEGKTEKHVERYLKRLFGVRFYGRHPLNAPSITFIPPRYSGAVKIAHKKSRLARYKTLNINERDPNLDREFSELRDP